ncbi:MAG: phosphoribosylformylglycinamidine synthase subunit PurS [Cyanobacteria bacterium]|jgi:phosphoribosylformylglycinamidine synthase|nr:phosphoribosylformylglycinamidine synthase subunit PurS [Cyanobacteria bacterium GSL.Bin1]
MRCLEKKTVSQQTYKAQIYVTLRPSVLDPAGTAVASGLQQHGYTGVETVRIGKYIELTVTTESEALARQQVDEMCDQLLANPVIENYSFELHQLATTVGG